MKNKNAQAIHDKSMELLQTVGTRFLHPEAIEILKKHGVKVDGNIAYFTEDEIMKCVEMAPSKFKIYARNSKFDIEPGSGHTYIGPMMGGIKVLKKDGTLRTTTVDDVIKTDKIVEYNDRYHVNGGGICTPNDIPEDQFMLFELYAGLMLSSKIPPDVSGNYHTMELCYDVIAAAFGCSKEQLREKPRILAGMNVNSPLVVDTIMTETMFTNLKYRQPCYIAPAAMGGSTAPITAEGTIVQNNAEVLSTLALAQMYEPGAPVLYGSQSTAADMRTLAIAIGAPESALCYKYAGIMGKFYELPVRSGGLMTDAKKCDVQAGYEPMLSFLACEQNGVDVVLQGAGVLDAYLTFSYEKLISDFQIVDYVDAYLKDIDVNDETVPMEDMQEIGHDSSFITADSTLEHMRTAILDPIISVRGPKPQDTLEKNTDALIQKALDEYRSPDIPKECMDNMKKIVLDYGIDESYVKKIENARVL